MSPKTKSPTNKSKASKVKRTPSKSSKMKPSGVTKAKASAKKEMPKIKVEKKDSDDESSDELFSIAFPPLSKKINHRVLKPGFEDPINQADIQASYEEPRRATGDYVTPDNKHNKSKRYSEKQLRALFALAKLAMLQLGRELLNNNLTNDWLAITYAYNRKNEAIEEAESGKKGTYLAKGYNDIHSALVKRPEWKGYVDGVLERKQE